MKTPEERFWAKVNKSTESGCWEWTGSVRHDGYGQFRFRGRARKAHRVVWQLVHGNIPPHDSHHGLCVLHKCDNRLCVNPDHLFLGTILDNNLDMIAKGRNPDFRGEKGPMYGKKGPLNPMYGKKGPLNPMYGKKSPYSGEKNFSAKISDAEVVEIRAKYSTGKFPQRLLGRIYNVSQRQICRIVNNKARTTEPTGGTNA